MLTFFGAGTAVAADPTPAEVRASVREMRKDTLDELYKLEPSARKAVRGSAGYAVFSQTGVQFLLVGGAGGRGVVRDNLNGKDTFMKMAAGGVGLGLGVKDTRLVGRSIWNTRWVLIIPGATLHADPEVGLDRFVDQVTDIKLIFDTYGQSGG